MMQYHMNNRIHNMDVLWMLWYALLDVMLSIFVLIPSRAIKLLTDEPFDKWIYNNKFNSRVGMLLIHGSGSNEAQFIISRELIASMNTEYRIYSCDLSDGYFASGGDRIEDYAEKAKEYIRSIRHEVDDLILVGHSMGGLVAGLVAMNFTDLVRSVVTIGTPWQGAPLLEYLWWFPWFSTTRHKQMTPGSKFLRELNSSMDKIDVNLVTIGSRYDLQVPNWYCHRNSYECHKKISTSYGHGLMIYMRSTWENVFLYMNQDNLSRNS